MTTIEALARDLECERTCAACGSKVACGACTTCLLYKEIQDGAAPVPSRSSVGRAVALTSTHVLSAIDRIDKLIEDIYVGRDAFSVQNYTAIGAALDVIRGGVKGK